MQEEAPLAATAPAPASAPHARSAASRWRQLEAIGENDTESFDVEAWDASGRRVGLIPIPGSELPAVETAIPNSQLYRAGRRWTLILDDEDDVRVVVTARQSGALTVAMGDLSSKQQQAPPVTFSVVPVAAGSRLQLDLPDGGFATELRVDVEADGVVDATLLPDDGPAPAALIPVMRALILRLELSDDVRRPLLLRLDEASAARDRGDEAAIRLALETMISDARPSIDREAARSFIPTIRLWYALADRRRSP